MKKLFYLLGITVAFLFVTMFTSSTTFEVETITPNIQYLDLK